MAKQNQAGFAVIEAVLIVVVLALIGGVGYWVVNQNKSSSTANQAGSSQSSTAKAAPTESINQSIDKAASIETAAEDASDTEENKNVDAAVNSAVNVGDSYNEDSL